MKSSGNGGEQDRPAANFSFSGPALWPRRSPRILLPTW
jgi:hypothetical protein